MNKQPLNVAIIGCGGYAGYLIDRLAELPEEWRLVAVTTRNPDNSVAKACYAKGIVVYSGADELLKNLSSVNCPVIIVPTSIESHCGYAKQMVDRGFHVLLEKPPVATVQDLDRLIELQHSSGRFISVNFQMLFSPLTQRLKMRIANGEFGEIKNVRAHALMMRPESYFARSYWSGCLEIDRQWVLDGTVGNPLAHLLAEALYLATSEPGMAIPAEIQAELYHANKIESEDTSCLRLKTTEGVPVVFIGSLCFSGSSPLLCEIETERAVIRLFDYFRAEIAWKDGRIERDEMPKEDIHLPSRAMFKAVAGKLTKNEKPLITVDECRPYMLAWNGAFESFGIPAPVSFDAVYTEQTEHGTTRCIRNLQAVTEEAIKQKRLFSELGIEWAEPGQTVQLVDYSRFPSVNRALIERGAE